MTDERKPSRFHTGDDTPAAPPAADAEIKPLRPPLVSEQKHTADETVGAPQCDHGDGAVMWNPYNEVTQCHKCGQVFDTPANYNACPICGAGDHDCDHFMNADGSMDVEAFQIAMRAKYPSYPLPYTPEPWDYSVSEDEATQVATLGKSEWVEAAEKRLEARQRSRFHTGDDPAELDEDELPPTTEWTGEVLDNVKSSFEAIFPPTRITPTPAAPPAADEPTFVDRVRENAHLHILSALEAENADLRREIAALVVERDKWIAGFDAYTEKADTAQQRVRELERENAALASALESATKTLADIGGIALDNLPWSLTENEATELLVDLKTRAIDACNSADLVLEATARGERETTTDKGE